MPRSFRLQVAVAVSLLAACSAYSLAGGDYQVTAVTVAQDGCGLMPESMVGHPAFVYRLDDAPTDLTVVLQNARAGNMVPSGAVLQGRLAHRSGQLYGAGGGGSADGCKYQQLQHATGTVDAPDQMTLAVTVQHDGREGCTPPGQSCTTVYSAHIERLPAP